MVDPSHRRRGVGTELYEWQIERARERLRAEPGQPWAIRSTTWEWIEDDRRLYTRFGLEAVRRFDEMAKALIQRDPVPEVDGVRIVPWDRTRDEESLLANNAAFADHWGATPLSMGNWRHLVGGEDTRLDASFFAVADDGLVGMALAAHHPLDAQVTGREEGWVRIISVDRDHRGRGIASALLASCHNAFLDAGFSHSALRVDSKSLTGANRLYEQLGYVTQRSSVLYEKRLS